MELIFFTAPHMVSFQISDLNSVDITTVSNAEQCLHSTKISVSYFCISAGSQLGVGKRLVWETPMKVLRWMRGILNTI